MKLYCGCGSLHVYENKLQEMYLIIPHSSAVARHMNEMLGSDNASLKMHLNTMQYYSATLHYPQPFVKMAKYVTNNMD